MGEGSGRFRGATFGGFHRQDVLNHLAQVDREHSQTIDQLQGELETLRGEAETRETRCRQAEEQLAGERQVAQDLLSRLEEVQATLTEQSAALDTLTGEAEALRTAVAQLEPRAQAYDRLKERAAAIELDAHERAQVILETAGVEAEELRQQLLVWMRGIQKSYGALCTRLEESFAASRQELAQIGEDFRRNAQEFGEYGAAIEALIRRVEAIAGPVSPKAPETQPE